MGLLRKTRAYINLDHIRHNYRVLKEKLGAGVKIAAVVKSNGYGHDAITMSALFLQMGVDYIAVANIEEAAVLRKHYLQAPLLVMGYTFDCDLDFAVKNRITLTVFSLAQCLLISKAAERTGERAKVHIKIDTGFNRLGYKDLEKALLDIEEISQLEAIEIEGIFSHLALESPASDEKQFSIFMNLIASIERKGINIPIKHICDSIGAVAYPEYHIDMVRVGALFYGYCSRQTDYTLLPALSLCTEISMVKHIKEGEGISYDSLYIAKEDRVIATLPIGYGDGLPRNIFKEGYVSIHGRKAPYVGLPCMDQCMVDVTGITDVKVGDEVLLYGSKGDDVIPLMDVARWCHTNRNEILTRISMRVPRVYFDDSGQIDVVDYFAID